MKRGIGDFEKTLREWREDEEDASKNLSKLKTRTQNPIIKMMIEGIEQDAKKHSIILSTLIDITQGGDVTSPEALRKMDDPEDLKEFRKELIHHIETEEKIIDVAWRLMGDFEDPLIRQVLWHILEDEDKHHKMSKDILAWSYTGRLYESPAELHLRDRRFRGEALQL